MGGRPPEWACVVHQDTIVKNRDDSWCDKSGAVELRSRERDVVRLPLSGLRDAFTSGGNWPYIAAAWPSA